MMIDPSKMSGIPRPDPQVPAGTITVRLIRGELSNRMIGIDVGLIDADGKLQKQKTDDQGRATFAGLAAPGPYHGARPPTASRSWRRSRSSCRSDMGARVMLVFQPKGGAADGVARPDKAIAPGTIIVRAAGEGGEPLRGRADVVLGHARAGESQVHELNGKTDANGEAKFDGLDAKPDLGLPGRGDRRRHGAWLASRSSSRRTWARASPSTCVRCRRTSPRCASGPARTSSSKSADDVVQVAEVWRLMNTSATAVDPGPNGLHLPLAEHALSAQGGPQNPPNVTVAGHEVVVKGPIAPGDTEVQVIFALAYEGSTLDFAQRTPLAFEDVALVTEKIDGLTVEGNDAAGRGARAAGAQARALSRAGHLGGRRHRAAPARAAAQRSDVALSGVGGRAAAARRLRRLRRCAAPAASMTRERLEQQREHLLGELAALEKTDGGRASASARSRS